MVHPLKYPYVPNQHMLSFSSQEPPSVMNCIKQTNLGTYRKLISWFHMKELLCRYSPAVWLGACPLFCCWSHYFILLTGTQPQPVFFCTERSGTLYRNYFSASELNRISSEACLRNFLFATWLNSHRFERWYLTPYTGKTRCSMLHLEV